MIKGDLYCKPCFLKVFKEKGSYASFGVKTLPNWKPGQEGEATPGTPPADAAHGASVPSAAASEAKADHTPAATSAAAAPVAAAAAAAKPADSGVNMSSSDLVNPKCKVCTKTVYDQEKQVYDKTVWHIACFKCLSCKRRIDVKAVAMIQGDLYCKPCFLKTFKEKGSYASFGPKTLPKWDASAASSAALSDGGVGSTSEPTTPATPVTPASPEPSTPTETPATIAEETPAEAAAAAE